MHYASDEVQTGFVTLKHSCNNDRIVISSLLTAGRQDPYFQTPGLDTPLIQILNNDLGSTRVVNFQAILARQYWTMPVIAGT